MLSSVSAFYLILSADFYFTYFSYDGIFKLFLPSPLLLFSLFCFYDCVQLIGVGRWQRRLSAITSELCANCYGVGIGDTSCDDYFISLLSCILELLLPSAHVSLTRLLSTKSAILLLHFTFNTLIALSLFVWFSSIMCILFYLSL